MFVVKQTRAELPFRGQHFFTGKRAVRRIVCLASGYLEVNCRREVLAAERADPAMNVPQDAG